MKKAITCGSNDTYANQYSPVHFQDVFSCYRAALC